MDNTTKTAENQDITELNANQGPVQFENIPQELKDLKQWVLWIGGRSKDGTKLTKVPKTLSRNGITPAKSNDSDTWRTFQQVQQIYSQLTDRFGGIMFAMTEDDPYMFVDLDNAIDQNGHIKAWAGEIVTQCDSYTEFSVSGTGIHIIGTGSKDDKWNSSSGSSSKYCRLSYHDGEVEVYDNRRFVTFSGNIVQSYRSVESLQQGLDWILDSVWPEKIEVDQKKVKPLLEKGVLNESDDDLLARVLDEDRKFGALFEGDWSAYPSKSESDLALCSKIAFWWKVPATGDKNAIDRIYRRSKLYQQGRSKWGRNDYRQRTIDKALEGAESRDSSYGSKRLVIGLGEKTDPDKPLELDSALTVAENLQKTDEHFAEVFIHLHGANVLWCERWKRWLVWNGQQWKADYRLQVNRMARDVSKFFLKQAAETNDNGEMKGLIKLGQGAATYARQTAMLSLVKTVVPTEPDELDADAMLLNTPIGTVDLTTGEVRLHNRNDKITKITKAVFEDINAECPRWENFLNEILNNNGELLDFMQRAIGYALTGEIRENVIFILHGDGANGKTTLVETVMHVLGDYAKSAAPDLLLQRRNESHPTGVADLMSARFVSSVEVDDGRKLNESLVKRLTGRDTIKARFMKQDFFDFTPSHKLFMAVNHRPEIQGTDKGIWRRIRLIPFEVEIPEEKQDQKLLDKLTEEASGILAWAVRGCLKWQHSGLGMPAAVKAASQAYKEESDVIGRFFDECCVLGKEHETQVSKLYDSFREWCDRNRERGYAANKFGQLVGKQNNLQKVRKRLNKKSCYVWQGIGLVSDTGENGSVSESDTPKNTNHIKGS